MFRRFARSPLRSLGGLAAEDPPLITGINYAQIDSIGGGQPIVLTGLRMAGVTHAHFGAVTVEVTSASPTEVVFAAPGASYLGEGEAVVPMTSPGVLDVAVSSLGGTSNAIEVAIWDPGIEPDCTLFCDSGDTGYFGGYEWMRRGGSAPGMSPSGAAGVYGDGYGAPRFNGTSQHINTNVDASALLATTGGTIASIVLPENEVGYLPEMGQPYDFAPVYAKDSSGPIGLFNWGYSGQFGFTCFAYDSAASAYVQATKSLGASSIGSSQRIVQTYEAGASMRLSVEGSALASASVALAGHPLAFAGNLFLARKFNGDHGFAGAVRVFATFDAPKDDAFVSRFAAWGAQRFGLPMG